MINNEEKIKIIINKLNNVQGQIDSYISHADAFKNKYSLDEVLPDCNAGKSSLLEQLQSLGGVWPEPLE